MSAAGVKGWCPGAHTPMHSGDGMIMRVRPRLGQLSNTQAAGLCDIAVAFGNGFIDLTNRANLQLRGIKEVDHQAVLDALLALELLDTTPELEARRNILCAPLRAENSLSERLAVELTERLEELPVLPAKFGFAIDADGSPQLTRAPADIRIENGAAGLMVRADGSPLGQPVAASEAVNTLISIARWFAETRSPDIRRMKAHLVAVPLPHCFARETTNEGAQALAPQQYAQGRVFGAAFGSLPAPDLRSLLDRNPQTTLTLTPFRMFMLSGQIKADNTSFITKSDDPALQIDACPGAPACNEARIETRKLADAFAPHLNGKSLHVSGCTKGCAKPRKADVVLVGQEDGFDLVLDGCSWDEPVRRGLTLQSAIKELGQL